DRRIHVHRRERHRRRPDRPEPRPLTRGLGRSRHQAKIALHVALGAPDCDRMPGSWAAATDGWRGREPLAVVLARALAPWPLWLVLWGDPDRGAPFVTAALVASLMAWRATRGADRSVGIAAVALTVGLAFGASV